MANPIGPAGPLPVKSDAGCPTAFGAAPWRVVPAGTVGRSPENEVEEDASVIVAPGICTADETDDACGAAVARDDRKDLEDEAVSGPPKVEEADDVPPNEMVDDAAAADEAAVDVAADDEPQETPMAVQGSK